MQSPPRTSALAIPRRLAWPFLGRFRVSRDSARSRWPRSLVGDERRRVVSRAGAPLPASSRSGVDAIKEAGGDLSPSQTRVRLVSIRRVSNPCAPRRNRATADPTGLVPGGAARGPRRGGARRETEEPRFRGVPPFSPRPDPGMLHARRCGRRRKRRGPAGPFAGGGAASAGRSRPVVPRNPTPPLGASVFGPRCPCQRRASVRRFA